MNTRVEISKKAQKQTTKLPRNIVLSLRGWVEAVEKNSLQEVRKVKGYHDEPLQGDRQGERSIRLSKSYRAIYIVEKGKVQLVTVIDVNKHKY